MPKRNRTELVGDVGTDALAGAHADALAGAHAEALVETELPPGAISDTFLSDCEKKFKSEPINIVARNAVNSVGTFSTINSNRVNELSHIFLNSVKRRNVKATNQGASGRCWMFAALNTFRHLLINALGLENFEFSEVYLFFWDKLERSNSYLTWFIQNPDKSPSDRAYDYMIENYMSDGGWWNTFANLVQKYGVIPLNAMKETFQSDDSDEMNKIIKDKLDSTVNYIRVNRNKLSATEIDNIRKEAVNNIYDTLVKFLGEPPAKFNWTFSRHDEDEPNGVIAKLTPKKFLQMVAPQLDMNSDFITLAHVPTSDMKYYQLYAIKGTNNLVEGEKCTFFNVPMEELTRYAIKSVSHGVAVWFAGDVKKCFSWLHSSLDDELDANSTVFGENPKFDKGDRILLRNVQANHAMAITGFNMDEHGKPVNWQVENSWGYFDNETPGLDGFLTMSQSWFEKYVTEIVVHKEFLSRSLQKKLAGSKVIELEPWDCMAPALRTGGFAPPTNYRSVLALKKK